MFSQINEPAHNLLKALKSHRNLATKKNVCLIGEPESRKQINFGHLIIKINEIFLYCNKYKL